MKNQNQKEASPGLFDPRALDNWLEPDTEATDGPEKEPKPLEEIRGVEEIPA